MPLFASLFGAGSGVCIVMYTRALRKVAFFSRPWEHVIFGVFGGAYAANKVVSANAYYEDLTEKLILDKMAKNKGVLDEKYRDLLGSKYAKYFPEGSTD